jgi:hypothetical protein
MCVTAVGSQVAGAHETLLFFGAVMKDHVKSGKGNSPYSPLACFLLLLMVGIFIKIGAASQLFHLTHN